MVSIELSIWVRIEYIDKMQPMGEEKFVGGGPALSYLCTPPPRRPSFLLLLVNIS